MDHRKTRTGEDHRPLLCLARTALLRGAATRMLRSSSDGRASDASGKQSRPRVALDPRRNRRIAQTSHVALVAATDLAKRSGAQLHLVTAYNLPAAAVYAYSGYFASDEPTDPFEADALAILAKEQVRVESLGGRVAALHTGTGPTFDVIERVADEVDADLIVVGSRDIGGLHRLLAGSVSTSVLHTTHRPVLIVRGGEHSWPPARLVVGVDRSRESKRAALIAASIGGLYADSVVELLEVLPDPLAPTAHYFNLDSELTVEHEHLDALAESLEHVTGHAVSAATAFGDPGGRSARARRRSDGTEPPRGRHARARRHAPSLPRQRLDEDPPLRTHAGARRPGRRRRASPPPPRYPDDRLPRPDAALQG